MGNQEEACSVTTGDEPRGQGLEEEGRGGASGMETKLGLN